MDTDFIANYSRQARQLSKIIYL